MSVTAVPIRPIQKGSVLKLWLGLALLVALAALLAWAGTASFQTVTTASGVRIETVRPGVGAKITKNDVIMLHYKLHVNSLTAPVVQDSNESPRPFLTTTDGVYPGFSEGLQTMRPSGSYVLTLPPGTHVQQQIPQAPFTPRDTLVFEIDVLQVERGAAQKFMEMQRMQALQQMQQMQQMQSQGGGGAPGGAEPAGH
ncbi:MAG: FKBP-type peptidyl-prolyl cis-trans isomerase [Alphaproteobacteria bacterium]|nr:FKBP-type peptidyl-prolyl cis-trans isomerase [Alphaproteobacteria bacterium]